MKNLADRFRRWYDYEIDCNAKTLTMLASVPQAARAAPEFAKAAGKMAHLVAARKRWLCRLGHWPQMAELFPSGTDLEALGEEIKAIQTAWLLYLNPLNEAELARVVEWVAPDGKRFRWDVEGILTQTHGHAFYHRGQVALMVSQLGGKAIDTDYLYWCKLPTIDE
jgi:uncharacterized damage-inducible protein DinB